MLLVGLVAGLSLSAVFATGIVPVTNTVPATPCEGLTYLIDGQSNLVIENHNNKTVTLTDLPNDGTPWSDNSVSFSLNVNAGTSATLSHEGTSFTSHNEYMGIQLTIGRQAISCTMSRVQGT